MADMTRYEEWMREALAEARLAAEAGEVAVGAVVVREGLVIGRGHNEREALGDPTAHAEMTALRNAAKHLGGWRLQGCTLVATLEPCPMCAGAARMARVESIVFGAYDQGVGCVGSRYDIASDAAFGAPIPWVGGVLGEECARVLSESMHRRRGAAPRE
jgi:tRNA(adenine34) deaminase